MMLCIERKIKKKTRRRDKKKGIEKKENRFERIRNERKRLRIIETRKINKKLKKFNQEESQQLFEKVNLDKRRDGNIRNKKTKRKGNKRDFENAKIKGTVINYQELTENRSNIVHIFKNK